LIKTMFRRLVLGELDPDHRATHVSFRPDRFALVRFPDRCPVCSQPGAEARELRGIEWVGVVLQGGFRDVRRGVLPPKEVRYCAEHAPEPSVDQAKLPGLKISTKTNDIKDLSEVIVGSENRDWIGLLREASRQVDDDMQESLVREARAKLAQTIARVPGWTVGPCERGEDHLWHASAVPIASGGGSPGDVIEVAAVVEWGALNALANLLEQRFAGTR
jgi:hypothetical protein